MQMTKSIEEEIKLGIFSKCETATVFYDKIVVSGLMNNKKRRHCQPPRKQYPSSVNEASLRLS